MPCSVQYHCDCLNPASHASHEGSSSTTPSLAPPPSLPAYTPSASHSFHALDSLYFCEECDAVRCELCVQIEISAFFCPTCLFEVPAASVKGERNRCARNCFTCPCCTHTLTLLPSDVPVAKGGTAPDPLSAAASVGAPPYLLTCEVCKWDSKEIGMTFEKSTGLSLQLQRYEDSAPDVLELDSLRNHFEPFVRAQMSQTDPKAATSGIASMPSAALRRSKLFRDVPVLSTDPRLLGRSRARPGAARKEGEVFKPYEARTSWTSGANSRGEGVVSRRDEGRIEWTQGMKSVEQATSLDQRWTSPWDQPVRANELRPTRVGLKAKQTKRCPVCRHIIIKPDVKANSKRYKIRLVAMSYLPDIFILPVAGVLSAEDARAKRQSTLSLAAARRRPQSVLGPPSIAGSGSTATIDEENLVPGRSYSFEATFTNPLDDAMDVRVGVALPNATLPLRATSPPPTSPSATSPGAAPISPTSPGATPLSPTRAARPTWTVVPSTTSFPISAFNEVWELDDEDADLLDAPSSSSRSGAGDDDVDDDAELERRIGEEEEDEAEEGARGGYKKSRTSTSGGSRPRRKRDGIVRRRGNATTIALDLQLEKEASGEIEFALFVSYSYKPGGDEVGLKSRSKTSAGDGDTTASSSDKSFSFWCAVRLGKCTARRVDDIRGAGESRASNLDKRRSMLFGPGAGLGIKSSAATGSTIRSAGVGGAGAVPAMTEEQEPQEVPRDAGNLATQL